MLIYCSFIYNVISPGAVISILTVGLHVGRMFMFVSCIVLFIQHYSLSTESTEKGKTVEKEFNILREVKKDFGSTAPSDISFVKEHLSRYAKHIYFLRVSNAQMTRVNRTLPDHEPNRITKRQLPHVFSTSRKERTRDWSHLSKNLPKMLKLCHITQCSFFWQRKIYVTVS